MPDIQHDTLAVLCPWPPGAGRNSLLIGTNTNLLRRLLTPLDVEGAPIDKNPSSVEASISECIAKKEGIRRTSGEIVATWHSRKGAAAWRECLSQSQCQVILGPTRSYEHHYSLPKPPPCLGMKDQSSDRSVGEDILEKWLWCGLC